MIILVSLVIVGIIAIEAPRLIKKRLWREAAAFSVLLLVGMVYSFGLALNWRLPNPVNVLKAVFFPVTQYLEHLLT
ncbi:MAG: hypothetical protein A4E53_02620 [Pelotomaculum sp. PtaB.Bin104]|nr:MAG: hypothetical protein A4E53_02620 [Pelotomaculum sp. PtaB.Bin104]